ncbi:hypothetical protein COOONC_00489 [Cooperia oncophora]
MLIRRRFTSREPRQAEEARRSTGSRRIFDGPTGGHINEIRDSARYATCNGSRRSRQVLHPAEESLATAVDFMMLLQPGSEHSSQELPELFKFNYLLDALQGEAKESVRKFQVTADNYSRAITFLPNRYGSKEELIQKLINPTGKLPSTEPFPEGSAYSF